MEMRVGRPLRRLAAVAATMRVQFAGGAAVEWRALDVGPRCGPGGRAASAFAARSIS